MHLDRRWFNRWCCCRRGHGRLGRKGVAQPSKATAGCRLCGRRLRAGSCSAKRPKKERRTAKALFAQINASSTQFGNISDCLELA